MTEWNLEVVSAFMRASYGKGYCDAFTEDSPGCAVPRPRLRDPGSAAVRPRRLTSTQRCPRRTLRAAGILRAWPGSALRRVSSSPSRSRRCSPYSSSTPRSRAAARRRVKPSELASQDRPCFPRRRGRRQAEGRRERGGPAVPTSRREGPVEPDGARASTREACPISSRRAGTSSSRASSRNGTFVATPGTMVTKCPSKYTAIKPPISSGRPVDGRSRPRGARSSRSACACTRASPGPLAAVTRRRRLAMSARNALIASFGSTLVAAAILVAGFAPQRLLARLRRGALEPVARWDLQGLRALGRPGGVAPALAPHPHGLLGARRLGQPQPHA